MYNDDLQKINYLFSLFLSKKPSMHALVCTFIEVFMCACVKVYMFFSRNSDDSTVFIT